MWLVKGHLMTKSIESDHTFSTQSQIGRKVPEFSAESVCLRQGMATSGRCCHMTLLDHVTPVGGWQLGCPGRCPCSVQAFFGGSILMASLILLQLSPSNWCHVHDPELRWHQRTLVTIPWWRQRDSAENLGTFPPIWLTVHRMCDQNLCFQSRKTFSPKSIVVWLQNETKCLYVPYVEILWHQILPDIEDFQSVHATISTSGSFGADICYL